METKQHATKNQWVNEFRNALRKTTMKTQLYKIYEMQQKQFLEVHSNTRPSSKHKK